MTSRFPSKDHPPPAAEPDPAPAPAPAGGHNPMHSFIGHHQQIDHALQQLQRVASAVHNALPSGEDIAEHLIAALTAVREAAAEHFAHEEKLMEDTGFSQTDEHRQTHRFFLTLIQMEMESLLRRTPHPGDPLCQTLSSWLTSHSRHQDAELALFLCQGGPTPRPAV